MSKFNDSRDVNLIASLASDERWGAVERHLKKLETSNITKWLSDGSKSEECRAAIRTLHKIIQLPEDALREMAAANQTNTARR